MTYKNPTLSQLLVSLSVFSASMGALSQQPANSGAGVYALEEVVVTAQKRSESLQDVPVAEPEDVDAFEVGLKGEFFERRLRFNAALFRYDYKNQPVLNVNPATQAQVLISLPKSEVTRRAPLGLEWPLDRQCTEAGNLPWNFPFGKKGKNYSLTRMALS